MLHNIDKNKFKYALRENKSSDTIINIKNVCIGGNAKIISAGPCTIKDLKSLDDIAKEVKKSNCSILRGGAFKPRTSPHDFQGLGVEGYKIIHDVCQKYDLISVSELTSIKYIEEACKYLDIIQVGSRNMQNFELLKQLGKTNKPILLKRGLSSTLEEWILSAEYIMNEGNQKVILCERGIRTFETFTRNTLDIGIVPIVKNISHLPIFVDPSHGMGLREYIIPTSLASIVAGADGLLIEADTSIENTLSDGRQTICTNTLNTLVNKIKLLKF